MATLYLTHGMTGSGKSTFAKKFCSDKNIIKLNHDEIMITLYGNNPPQEKFKEYFEGVNKLLEKLTKDLLNKNNDVFLDLGLFERSTRDFWRNLAKEYNSKCIIFFVECPTEIALKRTLNRTAEKPEDAFFIDENAFNIINSKIEPLQEDEEYTLIKGV